MWDSHSNSPMPALSPDAAPKLMGRFKLPDGRRVVTAFTLIAERFLEPEWAAEKVAERCGVPADTIRRIAAELARTAFEEEIALDVPWTDHLGRYHEKMVGRPVSMHAMRGISAHANGFQTCRTIHLLQILLGTIDVPGGFRYKPPFPKPPPPGVKPAGKPGQVKPNTPLPGPPLGLRHRRPKTCWSMPRERRSASTRPIAGMRRLAAHGMMHMVITNAAKKDPYGIDVLFMYMANMSWNSAMNVPDTIKYLTQKEAGRLLHDPEDHLFRRLCLRDGAIRRPDPAGHHLSRALGLHLAARPADLGSRWPGGFDPPAGGRARPRRAPLPDRAARPRHAAGPSRHDAHRWLAALSRRLSGLHRQP